MDKIYFSIKIRPKFGFSLDVISLLVSQFDLQNKKYSIGLYLVVAEASYWFGCCIRERCICPGQYILLLDLKGRVYVKAISLESLVEARILVTISDQFKDPWQMGMTWRWI